MGVVALWFFGHVGCVVVLCSFSFSLGISRLFVRFFPTFHNCDRFFPPFFFANPVRARVEV